MVVKDKHTFHINYTGDDGVQYVGQFTSKKLSIMDQSRIAVKTSQLCGSLYCVRDNDGNPTGQGIPEEIELTNKMLATISVALIQKPEWFDFDKLSDNGLVIEIWKKIAEGESSFRGNVKAPSSNDDSVSSPAVSKVVGSSESLDL